MKKGTMSSTRTTNPVQMAKGDPKMASSYPSVDSNATRKETARTPRTLSPRDA
jgi:hypothetical protein